MGSQLFPNEVLKNENYDYITAKCAEALKIINKYQK